MFTISPNSLSCSLRDFASERIMTSLGDAFGYRNYVETPEAMLSSMSEQLSQCSEKADLGDAESQVQVALLLLSIIPLQNHDLDYVRGPTFKPKLASQNTNGPNHELALCYETQAKAYLMLAADQGHKEAQRILADIAEIESKTV